MDDFQRRIDYWKQRMGDWSYGRIKGEANSDLIKQNPPDGYQHWIAAVELAHEMEQAHEDEITERHHKDILEQDERHHQEELKQAERHFRETKRLSNISNVVAIVAALSAMAAAYFAGESAQQSKTSQASPPQIQWPQRQIPNASDHPTVLSEQPSPSVGTYPASSQSPTPAPAPQRPPQQSASAPPAAQGNQ